MFQKYKEYCTKSNVKRFVANNMMGRYVRLLFSGVTIRQMMESGSTGYFYGLRLLSPKKRHSQELSVPEFCEWKIEDGNFHISIPKLDLCDGEVVLVKFCVQGETGKLSLHIRNKEVNVEGIGLSSHVILDQVWVNSVIRITQYMKLCRGVQSDPPAAGLTKSIEIHQWNNMLCSPEDITIGMHGQHCELIQSWMSIKSSSACNNCSHDVRSLLIRKHDQEQSGKYIAEGNIILEGNTKDKRKGKKRRKKGSVNKVQNNCDCVKSKKLRLSPNCHHMPVVSERTKTVESVVHPVTLVKNKAAESHSNEMREESKHSLRECNITDGMPTIRMKTLTFQCYGKIMKSTSCLVPPW